MGLIDPSWWNFLNLLGGGGLLPFFLKKGPFFISLFLSFFPPWGVFKGPFWLGPLFVSLKRVLNPPLFLGAKTGAL